MRRPVLCNYYVTYRCNSNCSYCDIEKYIDKEKRIDCLLSDVQANLPQLKKMGVKFIDFTGGEPLLHSKLPEMLIHAKNLGFYTSVTTNCLLYPRRAEEIKGLVDLLHFSLDSNNESENNRHRCKRSYESVMQSIEIAQRLNERPDLLFTVTRENFKAIEDLSALAAKLKFMLIVNPVFFYSSQNRIDADTLDYIEQFKNYPYVYINRAFHRLIRQGGNRRNNPRCRAVSSSVVISPNNELLLPCFHYYREALPIHKDLKELTASRFYNEYRRKQGTFPFCEGCTINCYFDPSFLYKIDRFLFLSLASKAKYSFDKYIRFHLSRIFQ